MPAGWRGETKKEAAEEESEANAIEGNDEDNKGRKGNGVKKTRQTLGRSGGSRKSATVTWSRDEGP